MAFDYCCFNFTIYFRGLEFLLPKHLSFSDPVQQQMKFSQVAEMRIPSCTLPSPKCYRMNADSRTKFAHTPGVVGGSKKEGGNSSRPAFSDKFYNFNSLLLWLFKITFASGCKVPQ